MKFEEIAKIDVSSYVEKKNGLSYLSWANAWREFCKVYPGATYEVKKNENGIPAFGDEKLGYMVYTTVTVEGLTHEMWLPVMNHMNKAVMNPDMFLVNKSVMRCLAKNLAMFGLGISLYAGEDIPDEKDAEGREIINRSGNNSNTQDEFMKLWNKLTQEQKDYFSEKFPGKYGPQKDPKYFKKEEKEKITDYIKKKGIA